MLPFSPKLIWMPFLRLTAEFELPLYPGTGEKVCVVGGGWWWWVCKPILSSTLVQTRPLALGLDLDQAEQYQNFGLGGLVGWVCL